MPVRRGSTLPGAGGGLELVRVVDNGCGIPAEELPLALASHATSKIAEADDLFRVGTLGFRGEALASIAEVSRLVLRSRTAATAAAAEIEVAGGHGAAWPLRLSGGHGGRGPKPVLQHARAAEVHAHAETEFGHVSEAFTRIALAVPQVHFTLRHNERQVFELAASEKPVGADCRAASAASWPID